MSLQTIVLPLDNHRLVVHIR